MMTKIQKGKKDGNRSDCQKNNQFELVPSV
jgi:hypothetical protein